MTTDPHVPLPSLTDALGPISEALDGIAHDQRVNWMRGLGKRDQVALWKLSEGGQPLDVAHFHRAEGEVVIHHGQNSLPAFTVFQKPMCLRGGRVQGYNNQAMSWFTGPGHFTVRADGSEVLFDYTALPDGVPDGFPPLADNMAGMSRFVYGGMIDRVRRVSRDCVIGRAWKHGKETGNYFMLTRE